MAENEALRTGSPFQRLQDSRLKVLIRFRKQLSSHSLVVCMYLLTVGRQPSGRRCRSFSEGGMMADCGAGCGRPCAKGSEEPHKISPTNKTGSANRNFIGLKKCSFFLF
jgi:hypothetical protein